MAWALNFYLLKIYFYYFSIGKADIQRGERERKIFRPMIHSPSERNGPILCRSEARSLFRVSHAGAGSQSLGRPRLLSRATGRELEAGLPGLEPAPIWDPGRARRGPLTTGATAPGPDLLSQCGVVSAWTEDLHPCFVWVLNMFDCIILGSMDIGQEVIKQGFP